ncbi:hypothetical protein EDB85DRAFT_1939839 [Lactarius pseudohatsudake]|nr:hypothetical protein EDB85DRAFT_1939839 [Lactarius pseudohatsudake]
MLCTRPCVPRTSGRSNTCIGPAHSRRCTDKVRTVWGHDLASSHNRQYPLRSIARTHQCGPLRATLQRVRNASSRALNCRRDRSLVCDYMACRLHLSELVRYLGKASAAVSSYRAWNCTYSLLTECLRSYLRQMPHPTSVLPETSYPSVSSIGGPCIAPGETRSEAARSGRMGLGQSRNAVLERAGRHSTLEAESEREALVARLDERSQRRSLFSGS